MPWGAGGGTCKFICYNAYVGKYGERDANVAIENDFRSLEEIMEYTNKICKTAHDAMAEEKRSVLFGDAHPMVWTSPKWLGRRSMWM